MWDRKTVLCIDQWKQYRCNLSDLPLWRLIFCNWIELRGSCLSAGGPVVIRAWSTEIFIGEW